MLFRSDYGSHLPVPVAMSSGEAEYISAAIACMRASHLRMLIYDLKYLCSEDYDLDNMEGPLQKCTHKFVWSDPYDMN